MFSTTQSWTAIIKIIHKIMKKLLFGLIAIVLFAFNGNAQEKVSQEEVRVLLAKGMADFTNSLKPAFEKTNNVEDFKKTVLGCWDAKIPEEGNKLLDAAYKILSKKLSEEEIVKEYNGKEMGAAVLYIDSLTKKGIKTDGSELFGGSTGDFNPYATLVEARCRWYQLGCWIKEIFGENAGQVILNAIVDTIVEGIKELIR